MATASYKTIRTYTAVAGQTTFNFALDYLRKTFILLKINGVEKTYGDDYTVTEQELNYPAGCAEGDIVTIQRQTTTDRLVAWADASVLRASDLTLFEVQLLHLQEETSDAVQTNAADEADRAEAQADRAEAQADRAEAQADRAKTEGDRAEAAAAVSAQNTAENLTTLMSGFSESAASSAVEAKEWANTAAAQVNQSFKNWVINGNFDIWQRGASQTSSGYGSADRWQAANTGTTKTASQQSFTPGQTEVPGNPSNFIRHVVTSVTGTSNFCILQQKIENVTLLSGKTVTLSFWAKADSAKNIAIDFYQNFGSGGSTGVTDIGIASIALTTSWKKYILTITLSSVSGKTIGESSYLDLRFWFDCGSAFDSNINALIGQQSGTFDIAQVQLEEGSTATPFEQRPIGIEMTLCTRYYHRVLALLYCYTANNTNYAGAPTPINFPIMRTSPTVTTTILASSSWQGSTFVVSDESAHAFIFFPNQQQTVSGAYCKVLLELSAEL